MRPRATWVGVTFAHTKSEAEAAFAVELCAGDIQLQAAACYGKDAKLEREFGRWDFD
jgi:hypothetical protein